MTKKEIHAALLAAIAEAETLNAKLDRDETEDARLTALDGEIGTLQASLDAAIAKEAADKERATKLAATKKTLNAPGTRITSPSTPGAGAFGQQKLAAEDDPSNGFKTPKEYLLAVMQSTKAGRVLDDRLHPLKATAGSDEHGEYADAYGGFFIPTGLMPGLKMLDPENDPTASMTTKIPMTSPTVKINARTDKDHTSSVTGGFRVYRRAETQTQAASRAAHEQVTLSAHTLYGVSYATNELITDSPISFAALISQGFGQEVSAAIFNEKLRGTGVGEYEGILNAPATVSVSKETGQTANTITYTNLVKMLARGWKPQMWLANYNTLPQLAQLAFVSGTGGVPFWMGSARDGVPAQLLGLPIYFTEFCETVGTVGDLILCNWGEYLEGTLEGVKMAESMHVRFLENESAFRVTVRNDGRCWWKTALTPKKGADTLSPFVTLATRA